MGNFTTDGYNKSRYGDKKIIEIDPLGAALKDAGHLGGAGKGGALRASNSVKLKQTIKNLKKTPYHTAGSLHYTYFEHLIKYSSKITVFKSPLRRLNTNWWQTAFHRQKQMLPTPALPRLLNDWA
mgnify:CR=1 FL=1